MTAMRWLLDTIGGIYELVRLGVITRFRLRGPYWRWRMETAFGQENPPFREKVSSILDYGRWIHRMRRDR
jgi:hypothetical protein